jgi:hypothetical protein
MKEGSQSRDLGGIVSNTSLGRHRTRAGGGRRDGAVSMDVLELLGGALKAAHAAAAASNGVIAAFAGCVTVHAAQARAPLGGDAP